MLTRMAPFSRIGGVFGALLMGSAFAFSQYKGSIPPPDDYKTGFDSISESYAKAILRFLAGPECEGRGSGQPGFQKAADFVAARFKEFGLKPMGDNGTYFQMVDFNRSMMAPGSFELTSSTGAKIVDGGITNISGEVAIDGPVVMLNYGANAKPTLPEGVNLDGKVVFLVGDKRSPQLEGAAVTAGASAVVSVVDKVGQMPVRSRVGKYDESKNKPSAMIAAPRAVISKKAFESVKGKLFKASPDAIQGLVDGVGTVQLGAKYVREGVQVPNVVALLEGSDEKLKSEYVGIGGHLDHLGIVNGVVYPGADDDGSGSTSVICIARAMSKNPVKPKRNILFMTFCGEEMGLIGSSYLVAHPMVPLNKMVAEFQMDMVARDSYGAQNGDPNRMDVESENHDTIRLVGSKRISTELDAIIQEANKSVGFRFKYDAEDVYTRSDHYNFAKNGIPIAFLFDGFTPTYHQPTDIVDTINFEKLANSARLYYLAANMVANRTEPPKKDVGGK